jgi:transposase
MRTGICITLKPGDRRRLAALARDRNAPHKHVWRAEIVLLSADGVGTHEIMRRTGKSKTCVWRWQERFMQTGYDGLLRDKTRPSRIPPLGSDIAERVIALTRRDPPVEATYWTASMMAKAVGISVSSVQRIWRAHGLQPHRVQQFKLSNDPKFIDKLRDVVGLYVDPPAHAIVLSVDEKSQIQALDRTQPGLPMKKGRAGTMTHDYKRHGTTTLFAALDVLEGKVIGRCMQRHRHQEFIRFLNAIEAQVPARKIVHVILDNYAAHKHPKVGQWLDRHPRFTFHFTPTSCSWLNAIEGFFAKLAKRRLKRGVFRCVVDLQAAINRFVIETNNDPKPFTWTADPDKIIAAVQTRAPSVRFHPLVCAVARAHGPQSLGDGSLHRAALSEWVRWGNLRPERVRDCSGFPYRKGEGREMLAFIYVFSIWVVATMLFVAVNAIEPNRRYALALKFLIVFVSVAAVAGRLMP